MPVGRNSAISMSFSKPKIISTPSGSKPMPTCNSESPTASRALWGAHPITCNGFTTAFSIRPPHGRKRAGLWQKLNGIPVNFTPVSTLSSPISAGRQTASSTSITSAAPLSSGSRRARTRSNGAACLAAPCRPTPPGYSFMLWLTIWQTSSGRWRCRLNWNAGR
jgi:hypothetical protein